MNGNLQNRTRTGTNIGFCRISNIAGRSVRFFGIFGVSGPNRVPLFPSAAGVQEDFRILAPDKI